MALVRHKRSEKQVHFRDHGSLDQQESGTKGQHFPIDPAGQQIVPHSGTEGDEKKQGRGEHHPGNLEVKHRDRGRIQIEVRPVVRRRPQLFPHRLQSEVDGRRGCCASRENPAPARNMVLKSP
jgi:hypothetical protein